MVSAIRSLDDLDVQGKRALVRVDFNVPLNKDGSISDDTRVVASLPTIEAILERGGSAVLMSHLGRPKGGPDPEASLRVVSARLQELLPKRAVKFAPDCIGNETEHAAAA